jgi:hypothetical protein
MSPAPRLSEHWPACWLVLVAFVLLLVTTMTTGLWPAAQGAGPRLDGRPRTGGSCQEVKADEKKTGKIRQDNGTLRIGGCWRWGCGGCGCICSGNRPVSSAYRVACRLTVSVIGNYCPFDHTQGCRKKVLAAVSVAPGILNSLLSPVHYKHRCPTYGGSIARKPYIWWLVIIW